MMLEKMPYNCLSQFFMMVFSLMVLVIVSVNADIRDIRILWSVHFRFIFARRQANNFILIFRCSDSDRIELKENKDFSYCFEIIVPKFPMRFVFVSDVVFFRKFVFVNSLGYNFDGSNPTDSEISGFRFLFRSLPIFRILIRPFDRLFC